METQEVRVELSRARDAANRISARMAKVLDQNRMQLTDSQRLKKRARQF